MASHSPSSLALGAVLAFVPGWAFSQQLYRITDLGTVGGPRSTAVGINDAGQVTGDSLLADATTIHAFRFSAGKRMIDLGTFAACRKSDNLGRESSAAGIEGDARIGGLIRQVSILTSITRSLPAPVSRWPISVRWAANSASPSASTMRGK